MQVKSTLKLPPAIRRKLYVRALELFTADPQLKRVIAPESWHLYLDEPAEDARPFGDTELPAVEILPLGLPAGPQSEAAVNSPLGMQLRLLTESMCDAFDLWEAFEAVFLGVSGSASFHEQLRAVHPRLTGVRLTNPAITPAPQGLAANTWLTAGTIHFDLTIPKR